MAVIRNSGRLVSVAGPSIGAVNGTLSLYDSAAETYESIYKTQPNVRTVVSLIARSIADLNLKWYRRQSDTDREHLQDHQAARLLRRPNQYTTAYAWKEAMVSDLAIFDAMLWVKVPNQDNDGPIALLRVPPQYFQPIGETFKGPDGFRLFGRDEFTYSREECVYIHGYNPADSRVGLSPIESLRRLLAEEAAAGAHREYFWANNARMTGILTTPTKLTQEAADRMAAEWAALYAGSQNAGKTAVLEQGLNFQQLTMSAEDMQYIAARRLHREEVAAAYHVPPSMVGILEHANFANIREQHLMLYQDCLGPWLTKIEEELMAQLLPEFADTQDVYCEFNVAEKLKGDFESQGQVLSTAVGGPYMTADEARARLNLPSLGGPASELAPPPNASIEAPTPDVMGSPEEEKAGRPEVKAAVSPATERRRTRHVEKHSETMHAFFARQKDTAMSKYGAGARKAEDLLNKEREDTKLRTLLHGLSLLTVKDFGDDTAKSLGGKFDDEFVQNYLDEGAAAAASLINAATLKSLEDALGAEDAAGALRQTFDARDADEVAVSRVTGLANFARTEAAKQAGVTKKRWAVTNPKSRHPNLDGETVPIDETFSNGLMWPGDPSGSVDETAGCKCLVEFIGE